MAYLKMTHNENSDLRGKIQEPRLRLQKILNLNRTYRNIEWQHHGHRTKMVTLVPSTWF